MLDFLKKTEPAKKTVRLLLDEKTFRKRMTWKYQKVWKKIKHMSGEDLEMDESIQMLIGRYMVNEKNEWLTPQQAIEILDELDPDEQVDVIKKFVSAIQNATIPKVNGSGLTLPSQAGQEMEMLPTGSTSLMLGRGRLLYLVPFELTRRGSTTRKRAFISTRWPFPQAVVDWPSQAQAAYSSGN